jgi:hypothetical protein
MTPPVRGDGRLPCALGRHHPLELRVAVGEVAGLAPGEEPLVLLPLGRHLEGR